MAPTRILIADDSAPIRRIVSEVLSEDPAYEVVATAPNGRIALARIGELRPDVVLLDVLMPDLDGLTALVEIRKTHPRLPVIMFSALTGRGAEVTIEALIRGASDYLEKPAGVTTGEARAALRRELGQRIDALCRRTSPEAAPDPATPAGRAGEGLELVVVAASTGGPTALGELLAEVGADLPAPIAIVQHMPPSFTALFAQSLASRLGLAVSEARGGEILRPGTILVAPGGRHLLVARDPVSGRVVAILDDGPPRHSSRPAADALFESAAAVTGAATLAVVLTGMGQDGLEGSRAVGRAGGSVLAQDEASSVVWGMPGFVARAGIAERIAAPAELGREVRRRSIEAARWRREAS